MEHPRVLFRAFQELTHAREFVECGKFRLSNIINFVNSEDKARADSSEGQGYSLDKDGGRIYFELDQPTFILCCSHVDVDLNFLRNKMGKFVVKINDPLRLAVLIDDWFVRKNITTFGGVKCQTVKYTKGQIEEDDALASERAALSLYQKSPQFCMERECRFVALLCSNDINASLLDSEFLHVDLGGPLSVIELLPT